MAFTWQSDFSDHVRGQRWANRLTTLLNFSMALKFSHLTSTPRDHLCLVLPCLVLSQMLDPFFSLWPKSLPSSACRGPQALSFAPLLMQKPGQLQKLALPPGTLPLTFGPEHHGTTICPAQPSAPERSAVWTWFYLDPPDLE